MSLNPITIIPIIIILCLVPFVLGIVALYDIQKRNLGGKGRAVFAIITGAFYVTILICIGIANLGSGRSSSSGNSNDVGLGQIKQATAANIGFGDALIRGNESQMNDAILLFNIGGVSGCSPEYQTAHKELYESMIAAMVARTNRSGDWDFDRRYSEQKAQAYVDSAKRYITVTEREVSRLQSGGR